MPSGAKKRKAAKKKQEQASSTPKSNNHESTKEDAVRIEKETDERIEITDSSHDHDKSSSSRSSGSGSGSSSSSDDESNEVKRKDGGDKEEETEVVTVVPSQPVPLAGDAPFIGSTANVIVENTGLMDSTTHTDPNTENIIEISSVDAVLSNEPASESSSLASDEIKQASSSSTTGSGEKESKCVHHEGSKESEVVISHEEEAHVMPTHGVAQRTSWLSCCGLFDVMTGSSR